MTYVHNLYIQKKHLHIFSDKKLSSGYSIILQVKARFETSSKNLWDNIQDNSLRHNIRKFISHHLHVLPLCDSLYFLCSSQSNSFDFLYIVLFYVHHVLHQDILWVRLKILLFCQNVCPHSLCWQLSIWINISIN